MRRYTRRALHGAALGLIAAGWGRQSATAQSGITVAVSTPVLAEIVANVAGTRAAVTPVIPANADPHTYEATPADVVAIGERDAFISMGAHLEPFIESGAWRRAVHDAGIPWLTLAEHLPLIAVDRVIDHGDHVHDLRDGDPHVWLDPLMVVELVGVVERFLGEVDGDGQAEYRENAAAYRVQLDALHEEMTAGLAAIPAEARTLVVFHDAYTYFAARYGFEVVGVVLKNLDAEPSAREIVALRETIVQRGVRAIFAEPQFNQDVLGALVEGLDVSVGELLTDSFAGRVETYLELMRFNLASLVDHLT